MATRSRPPSTGSANAWLGLRYFPPSDALTAEEYHRIVPDVPAPLQSPPPPAPPPAPLICPHCDAMFVPHVLAKYPRFCSSVCRRRFHARLSYARRKAAA
jgi:hypothetical protein